MTEVIKDIDRTLKLVDDTTLVYEDITNKIVEAYIGDLDELIKDFNEDAVEKDADDRTLEKYLFELGSKLYFLSAKLEQIGIKDDISKMIYKEEYNLQYLANREKDSDKKNKLTVAELTAIAESLSKEKQVVNSLYSRIYSQIKMRMSAGYDLVSSIRKIITKRMQDQSLSFTMSSDPKTYEIT